MAGAGGLWLFGALAAARRQRRRALLLLVAAFALLVACSGGGSDGGEPRPSEPPPAGEVMSETLPGLAAGTTYYWKVISTDARGATAESPVFRFTTRP